MPRTVIAKGSALATGINVFVLPRERQAALMETLRAVSEEIIRQRMPMVVSGNFHRGIDASIVVNYNQYRDRESGNTLRKIPETAPLLKRTHDLSDRHEIRWYKVEDVIVTGAPGDRLEISQAASPIAALGIHTAAPGRQDALLAHLRAQGERLKRAPAPGFLGLATHRGFDPAHVACYEQWESVAAYEAAARTPQFREFQAALRDCAEAAETHLYEVVEVAVFDFIRPETPAT
jgi:quinol monooxygenase YgiN